MRALARAYDAAIFGLAGLAGALIAAIFLLVVGDVMLRTAGFRPPAFVSAAAEYALLYATMLAAPWMVRTHAHVTIESLTGRFGAGVRRVLGLAIALLCLVLALIAAWAAARLGLRHFHAGNLDIRSVTIPRWVLFAPLVLGFGLCAAEYLRLVLRGEGTLRAGRDAP